MELSSEAELLPFFAATAILSTSLAQLEIAKKWLQKHLDSSEVAESYLVNLMAGTYTGFNFIEGVEDSLYNLN